MNKLLADHQKQKLILQQHVHNSSESISINPPSITATPNISGEKRVSSVKLYEYLLKDAVCYFDGLSTSEINRLRPALQRLNTTIVSTFSPGQTTMVVRHQPERFIFHSPLSKQQQQQQRQICPVPFYDSAFIASYSQLAKSLDEYMALTTDEADSFSTVTTTATTSDNSSNNNTKGSVTPTTISVSGSTASASAAVNERLTPFCGEYLLVWDYTQRYRPIMLHDYGNPAVNDRSNMRALMPPRLVNMGLERSPFSTVAATANASLYASTHAQAVAAANSHSRTATLGYFDNITGANMINSLPFYKGVQQQQQLLQLRQIQHIQQQQQLLHQKQIQQQQLKQLQQVQPQQVQQHLKRKGPTTGFDGDFQPLLKKNAVSLPPQTKLAMTASAARTSATLLPMLNYPLSIAGTYNRLQQPYNPKPFYSIGNAGFTTPPSQQQNFNTLNQQQYQHHLQQKLQQKLQQRLQQQKPQQGQCQKPKTPKKPHRMLYCENCNEHFINFDTHIESPRHKAFSTNETNFLNLDNIIFKVGTRSLKHGAIPDNFSFSL